MNFSLPEDALLRIAAQLNLNGTFNHTVRTPWNSHQVTFRLRIERGSDSTVARVEMGGQVHSITVANTDPCRHLLVADLIDAIANGRVDSAEPAPARVTRHPVLPEPDQLLTTEQLGRIKYLVRHGGFAALETGLANPINVAVHRARRRITAIVSIGTSRPRTSCFTVSDWAHPGTDREATARLLAGIEQMHIAATAQQPAAA